jgi:hypothetical protein
VDELGWLLLPLLLLLLAAAVMLCSLCPFLIPKEFETKILSIR